MSGKMGFLENGVGLVSRVNEAEWVLESEFLIVGALCSTPFLIFGAYELLARRRRRKAHALATRTKRRPTNDRNIARR